MLFGQSRPSARGANRSIRLSPVEIDINKDVKVSKSGCGKSIMNAVTGRKSFGSMTGGANIVKIVDKIQN